MKKRQKQDCRDLTLMLLRIIAASSGAALLYGLAQGRKGKVIWQELSRYNRSQIINTLKGMRLRKLVNWTERDKNSRIVLTDKGWRRLNLSEKNDIKAQEWDLLWRIVVFDIANRNKRNIFRKDLKKLGWRRLQQSVYVYPLNILEKTKKCISYHKLSKQCACFTAANLGHFENKIRKCFFGSNFL